MLRCLSSRLLRLLLVALLLMLSALLLLGLLGLRATSRGVLPRLVVIRQPYLQQKPRIGDDATCHAGYPSKQFNVGYRTVPR